METSKSLKLKIKILKNFSNFVLFCFMEINKISLGEEKKSIRTKFKK